MFVDQMPTFIAFNNGQKVKQVVGANPEAVEVFATRSSIDAIEFNFDYQDLLRQSAAAVL